MASIFNHSDFWHSSGDVATNVLIKNLGKCFITFSWIEGAILCVMTPLIVFGNAFVVYAVRKDPLRNLRSSPSNFILQSMATADLLVGLVLSPIHAYWLLALAVSHKIAFSFHAIYSLSSTLIGASLAHVMLLSIDRLCAVVTPLKYKSIVTRRRIKLAVTVLWFYFICFGIGAFVFVDSFFIISLVFGVHTVVMLNVTFYIYVVILYRLRKNYKFWQKRVLGGDVRVSHQCYSDKEMLFAKAMAIVICVSLFIITPHFVLLTLVFFCIPCYSYPKMLLVCTGLEITLTYLNLVVNPFVYCWRLPKYREVWKRYVKTTCQCCTRIKRRYRERGNFDTKL